MRVGSARPREQPKAACCAPRSTQTAWAALACAACPAVMHSFRRLVCAKQSRCGVLARPLPGTFFRVLSPLSACPQCSLSGGPAASATAAEATQLPSLPSTNTAVDGRGDVQGIVSSSFFSL